jgi:hypothetical protein
MSKRCERGEGNKQLTLPLKFNVAVEHYRMQLLHTPKHHSNTIIAACELACMIFLVT